MKTHKAWIGRWRVTFKFDTLTPHEGVHCSWEPGVPEPSALTKKERRRYLAARHKFLTDVAKEMGTDVLVVDL